MPIVPPAAISPHDTWFGKSLGKLGLAPAIPVAREKIIQSICDGFCGWEGGQTNFMESYGTFKLLVICVRMQYLQGSTPPLHLESLMILSESA